MNKIANKYRAFVRFMGFCFIGIGFYYMVFAMIIIIRVMVSFFISPAEVDTGMVLLLPGMSLPGFGFLSFWHWIIAIFLLAIIHEGAHGIMARAYNVKIKASGFAFFSLFVPLLPAAFVEIDENQLKKMPDYVNYSISAAGPLMNILVAVVLLLALPWVNPLNLNGNNLAPYEDYFSDANGFSVNVMDNLPAYNASLRNGAIINSVNSEKVDNYLDFAKRIQGLKPDDEIVLGVDNGTQQISHTIVAMEHPEIPDKGYIGIVGLRDERVIKSEHKVSGNIFYWFKGFFIWFYLFNFAVGIANLLPLGILDGGRMLKTLFNSVFKNKKRAQELWIWISFLFLALLLVGIVAHYLQSWGLF
tara:strand:- start:1050 stop:2126 length:1077 start_codon:yes stop_codon:yes gene_type:complete